MKIKIFVIGSPDSFLDKPGGAYKSILLLASGLIKNGHTVSLICFGKNHIKRKINFNRIKIPISEYKISKFVSFLITPFLYSLYKIVKKEEKNTDILHFYNVQLDPLAGLYKIFNKNKKIISTLNNYCYISSYGNFEYNSKNKSRYKYNFLQRMLAFFELFKQNYGLTKALVLIFLTPFLSFFYVINIYLSKKIKNYVAIGRTIRDIYYLNGFENIKVIPNMYDVSFSSKKIVEKQKVVLFVGRIKKSKGIENLILAFKKSHLIYKGYILKIIGSGNQLKNLKNKYEDKNILFLGNIPYNNIKREYSNAEIFVHPGLLPEPFGRTILEAIQNDCKILVSNIGEPPKIVEKKDCIYEYNNIEKLTKKLETISSNKKLGIVNKIVLEKYSPDRVVKMYEDVYHEL